MEDPVNPRIDDVYDIYEPKGLAPFVQKRPGADLGTICPENGPRIISLDAGTISTNWWIDLALI